MWLASFDENPYGTNCWLLARSDGDEAVVVDPGFEPERLRGILDAAGKRLAAVALTHAHLDHAREAGSLAGDDVPVYVHAADAVAFEDPDAWNAGFDNALAPVKDLRAVDDGDVLRIAGLELEVAHTPGHTPGHCCLRTDDALFTGDLVFAGSIGRSDFPNSSPELMRRSLRWFLGLPDELAVEPGHGPETTVGSERATNPFLLELS